MQNLEIKSGKDLVASLKTLVERERLIGIEILEYLCEVDRRKLHVELGYSSLFVFAVKELKFSEGSAYRRIAAMLAMCEIPILKEKIATGLLNVSTIADVACVLKAEAKRERSSAPISKFDVQEKCDLYLSFTGKSSRQVKQELAAKFSDIQSNVTRGKEFNVSVSPVLESRISEFKALASHRLKTGTDEEVLGLMLDLSLKQLDRERTGKREERKSQHKDDRDKSTYLASAITSTTTSAPANRRVKNSRYIPVAMKQLVWKRAEHKCEYFNPETRIRCATAHYLQIEHIKPHSHGGSSTDHENLMLLCGTHNRYLWDKFQRTE